MFIMLGPHNSSLALSPWFQDNPKLLLQVIDLEYQQATVDEQAMAKAFDTAITSKMAVEHRVAFSQRRLEFLEDFGSNVSR